jgi:hypothetical protein
MKSLRLLTFIGACALFLSLESCTYRLVDFTVISTKNAEIGVDRTKGVAVEGKKSYFLGMGWNVKDVIDLALESAGPQYDLLIDGVVSYQNFPFVLVVKAKGTAVSSGDLKAELGNEGFENWCKANNVYTNNEKITSN